MKHIVWVLCLLALPVRAESIPCSDHATVTRALLEQFQEKVSDIAITDNGSLLEVLRGPKSWTIILTKSGLTCLMASGKVWERDPRGVGEGL